MALSAEKLSNIASFYEEIDSPNAHGITPNAPLLLVLEATTRCNFKCVHCARAFADRPAIDMSLALFERAVPVLRTAFELYLFGDGEVLLNTPRHLAMIARIYQEDPGARLQFSTNGKLLTPEVYELYATAGIHQIQVSVDAADKELYESMRRGGSFDQLVRNLDGIVAARRRLKTRQPELHLATVISQQNYRQLPLLAEFARKYEFSRWYINTEHPLVPGRELLRLTREDLVEVNRMKAHITENYSSCFPVVFDAATGLPSDTRGSPPEADSPVFCTVPWQRFELKANGDVKICPYYHQPICSMNGRSIRDVWNGPEFRRVRKAFASGSGIPSHCLECKLGMRRQFLPASLGIPRVRRTIPSARLGTAVGRGPTPQFGTVIDGTLVTFAPESEPV
ncbi:MAG TPA: radical SAM protein [Bryobacteraceae bacterium]|nr:radical SAM protein [Bryobacteraceae bacterium]